MFTRVIRFYESMVVMAGGTAGTLAATGVLIPAIVIAVLAVAGAAFLISVEVQAS